MRRRFTDSGLAKELVENLEHKQTNNSNLEQSYLHNKAKLYILRLRGCLVEFFADQSRMGSQKIANRFNFSHICENSHIYDEKPDVYKDKILRFLDKEFARFQALQKQCKFGRHKVLEKNLRLLQNTLNLDYTQIAVVELVAIASEISYFKDFLYEARRRADNARENILLISKMLELNQNEVRLATGSNSILIKANILCGNRELSFYDDDFGEMLFDERSDKNQIESRFVIPCDKSTLTRENYAHIKEFDMLQKYLSLGKMQKKKGVNVLLYGIPGTGKTELAKLLAQNINVNLYKVRSQDSDGEPQDGMRRFGSYLLAQRFLDSSKDLLLYDEAEDVLNRDGNRFKNKAFFNETLENNPLPTIWITNNIRAVDNAAVRRFDFVIEMGVPKKGVRKAILEKICGEKLNKKTRKLIQQSPNLAPALIARANEVSSVIGGDFSKNFLMLLNNTLKAQGYSTIKKDKSKDTLPKSYSTDFINADCDISRIASGLDANPNARICLYGLSGTGKSAFAQFIAKSLKRPCIIKAVSDLESKWVGETEKNIARAFKEAKDKKAVLVFDEVDSFLCDRSLAVRGFEATKVNEMLLQMEKFNGIFVATTNLMDNIDKAALRRFDLKVEFKALNRAQRVNLFKKECTLLGLKCEVRVEKQIERLECLTPGDFAAIKRQHKFSPIKDSMDFYTRLCEEVKVKDLRESGANMGVGFLR